MNKGFTLIEVIIYIALFSLLMGSAFITAYQLIDGSNNLSSKNTTEEEGNFVMRKINWALTSAESFTISGGDEVQINRYSNPTTVEIKLETGAILLKRNSVLFVALTTDNVDVTALQFDLIPASGPGGITATAIIDGIDFTITKYIRQ